MTSLIGWVQANISPDYMCLFSLIAICGINVLQCFDVLFVKYLIKSQRRLSWAIWEPSPEESDRSWKLGMNQVLAKEKKH